MSQSNVPFGFISRPRPLSKQGEEFLSLLIEADETGTLRDLENLKKIGWSHDDVHEHFQEQRARASVPSEVQSEMFWLGIMQKSMKEMDKKLQVVQIGKRINFLDLGCAPGGYSKYVLEKNRNAIGTGISLPVEDGGHTFIIPEELRQGRYTVHFADMTTFDIKPSSPSSAATQSPTSLQPLPFPFNSLFHLIILDGHVLHTRPRYPGMNRILLFTQLIIALQHIAWNGTIFIKLSKAHEPLAARILFMLDTISNEPIRTTKPLTIHSNRGTFYVVAKRIQRNKTLQEYISKLHQIRDADIARSQALIEAASLTSGNVVITREDEEPEMDDDGILDILVPLDGLVKYEMPRLLELSLPVWTVQRDNLRWMLQRKGALPVT